MEHLHRPRQNVDTAEAMKRIPVDEVVCDFCNKDYTNSDRVGGYVIPGWAVCPDCASKQKSPTSKKTVLPLPGEPFAAFIRRVRGPNAAIIIKP